MKIEKVTIHNLRNIEEISFNLEDFSMLVGENNSGKSTVFNALRMFYEDLKYNASNDFPKFTTKDNESWMEIQYSLTDDENETLKEEYKNLDKKLKVRKYFKSDIKDLVKSDQSNLYGYENGQISSNLFYGAKNIAQAKLGGLIYIPEITKTDDSLKLSGPSPFREMMNFIMKTVIKSSQSYKKLESSFSEFNKTYKEEKNSNDQSVEKIVTDINENLKNWQVRFGVNINAIEPEEIVKSLLSHHIIDENLGDKVIDVNNMGQGLQRHLIYTLIRLSAKYKEKKTEKKKDFSPDFKLLLFEEPEAFLHPSQQEQLNIHLRKFSEDAEQQVIITTHSPIFVGRNFHDIKSLIRLSKIGGASHAFQMSEVELESVLDENISLAKMFQELLKDASIGDELKKKIRKQGLAVDNLDIQIKLEQESIKFFLWLDFDKSALFFSKHVIICEGASEKILFDFLTSNKWIDIKEKQIYFLDALGKFNIHRYMNLFDKLGISHSVIVDKDNDRDYHKYINEFIEKNKKNTTKKIEWFDEDVEKFLGISKIDKRDDLKPLNIMQNLMNNSIDIKKIDELKGIVESLL